MNNTESSRGLIKIESFGGVGGLVTGSNHRVSVRDNNILIDKGLFQGKDEILDKDGKQRNSESISTIVRGTSSILATHVHIDHTGLIPLVFRNGFTPTIYTTEETAAFMDVMLRNSAEIQAKGKKKDFIYSMDDVDKTLRHIKIVDPFREVPVGNRHSNLTAEFLLNGHVIGSSSILLRDKKYGKNILFTGDMGKPAQLICGGYEEFTDQYPNDSINAMVVESTCFENTPVAFEERKRQLLGAIKETWEAGGNPLLPVLSFHRAQELMEIIHNCQMSGEIPSDCEIFIDAPLAMKVLETFKELGPAYFTTQYGDDPEFYKTNQSSMDRFNLKNLTVIGSHEESKLMDEKLAFYPAGKAILIASGGMGERGRSVNYIRGKFNQNPKNSIIFNCFQVKGTKGSELVNRSKTETDPTVRARIIGLDGNTSHISGADQTFDFLERFNLDNLETVIIGHGRDSSRKAMAAEFKKRGYYYSDIILSRIGQEIAV